MQTHTYNGIYEDCERKHNLDVMRRHHCPVGMCESITCPVYLKGFMRSKNDIRRDQISHVLMQQHATGENATGENATGRFSETGYVFDNNKVKCWLQWMVLAQSQNRLY